MIIGLCALGTAVVGGGVGMMKFGAMAKTLDDLADRDKSKDASIAGLQRMVYEMRGQMKHDRESTP